MAFGTGTMGTRSTVIGGTALWLAADQLIAKGCGIAAHLLEVGENDITFDSGRFVVAGTDRALSLTDVAKAAFRHERLRQGIEPGFYETGTFSPKAQTFPNSCHVCEVEIDPDTGGTTVVGYWMVDDVGDCDPRSRSKDRSMEDGLCLAAGGFAVRD